MVAKMKSSLISFKRTDDGAETVGTPVAKGAKTHAKKETKAPADRSTKALDALKAKTQAAETVAKRPAAETVAKRTAEPKTTKNSDQSMSKSAGADGLKTQQKKDILLEEIELEQLLEEQNGPTETAISPGVTKTAKVLENKKNQAPTSVAGLPTPSPCDTKTPAAGLVAPMTATAVPPAAANMKDQLDAEGSGSATTESERTTEENTAGSPSATDFYTGHTAPGTQKSGSGTNSGEGDGHEGRTGMFRRMMGNRSWFDGGGRRRFGGMMRSRLRSGGSRMFRNMTDFRPRFGESRMFQVMMRFRPWFGR